MRAVLLGVCGSGGITFPSICPVFQMSDPEAEIDFILNNGTRSLLRVKTLMTARTRRT
jgi:hypothetical protein